MMQKKVTAGGHLFGLRNLFYSINSALAPKTANLRSAASSDLFAAGIRTTALSAGR
jgi:hypothetical protein